MESQGVLSVRLKIVPSRATSSAPWDTGNASLIEPGSTACPGVVVARFARYCCWNVQSLWKCVKGTLTYVGRATCKLMWHGHWYGNGTACKDPWVAAARDAARETLHSRQWRLHLCGNAQAAGHQHAMRWVVFESSRGVVCALEGVKPHASVPIPNRTYRKNHRPRWQPSTAVCNYLGQQDTLHDCCMHCTCWRRSLSTLMMQQWTLVANPG